MQPLQLHLMSQFLVVRRFTFAKSFLAFAIFALFSLEACVGWSGPGTGMSLSAIANTNRYAVARRRARNARCRTLLMRVALLCPTLVRLSPLSLGRSVGIRILDAL